jgi:hypothetical protein
MQKKILTKLQIYYKRIFLGYHALLNKDEPKIFCISMQRSGTSSVGKFLENFDFRCVDAKEDHYSHWSELWLDGNYDAIFSSPYFKGANAYEDTPWFFPEFYKFLFHRFKNAKFILFEREPSAWFDSMVNHSKGDIIGSSQVHCKIYRRELEYLDLLNSDQFDETEENLRSSKKTMKLINHADYYKSIYQRHTLEVQNFFSKTSPESLHVGHLDDPQKWQKLGHFLNITVPDEYDCHQNQSSNLAHYRKSMDY